MIHRKILEDDNTRAQYFHDLAENSRALELLLNTSYNFGIIPINLNFVRQTNPRNRNETFCPI